MTADVIIIGGGISGLATAEGLVRHGLEPLVLERQTIPGGNAISERINGFLMEHGPSTFNASVPGASEHLDALGLLQSACDLGPDVKRRYLRDQGRLTGVSAHPTGFLLSNYLSPLARMSLLTEALRPPKQGDKEETIHQFTTRRFGREFADKVIEPLAAGLFMGDSARLSINGAFARLADMEREHGSITRAILKARKGSEPGRHLYSWSGGIGTIPRVLVQRLGARIRTGVAVLGLGKTGSGFEVSTNLGTLRSRAVVLAVQPHVAAALMENLDAEGAGAAGSFAAPPVSVIFLGYRRDQVGHPLDGLGFLSTKDPSRIISGAQFATTMYQGRAPTGHVAISTYAGGVRNPELAGWDDARLVAETHRELAGLLDIKGMPVLQRARRWSLGLPQYELGHRARAALLRRTSERVEGLFVTGNFLSGVSVANCLSTAAETASRVGEALTERPANSTTKTA